MRKVIAVLLALTMILVMAASCTSKTPDVVASEQAASVSIDDVDWTITVEGADVTSYSLADAKAHELSKMTAQSYVQFDQPDANGFGGTVKSYLVEGIFIHELLEDLGRTDATKVTFYGKDATGAEVTCEITEDLLTEDDCILAWIMNKTEFLPNYTDSHVGIFAKTSYVDFTNCCNVNRIVIE